MQPRRGRPPTFEEPARREFAELIRQHGIRGTKAVSMIPICETTLIRIAREFHIELKPGRRKKAA